MFPDYIFSWMDIKTLSTPKVSDASVVLARGVDEGIDHAMIVLACSTIIFGLSIAFISMTFVTFILTCYIHEQALHFSCQVICIYIDVHNYIFFYLKL